MPLLREISPSQNDIIIAAAVENYKHIKDAEDDADKIIEENRTPREDLDKAFVA